MKKLLVLLVLSFFAVGCSHNGSHMYEDKGKSCQKCAQKTCNKKSCANGEAKQCGNKDCPYAKTGNCSKENCSKTKSSCSDSSCTMQKGRKACQKKGCSASI